jgi:hypothetical protein
VVDARKIRFGSDELPELFAGATRLAVAKGKSPLDVVVKGSVPAEVLAAALGPSGNLRAPTVRIGTTFLVGFDEALWTRIFDGA